MQTYMKLIKTQYGSFGGAARAACRGTGSWVQAEPVQEIFKVAGRIQ